MELIICIVICISVYFLYRLIRNIVQRNLINKTCYRDKKGGLIINPIVAIYMGCLGLIGVLLCPPIRTSWRTGARAVFLSMPRGAKIDWSILCIEILLIVCIVILLFLVLKKRYESKVENELKPNINSNKTFFIPLKPTVSQDWIIGGLHVGDTFDYDLMQLILGKVVAESKREVSINNNQIICKTFICSRGRIDVISNKMILIESFKEGIATPRGIIIGKSTVHDVISLYGTQVSNISHEADSTIYTYCYMEKCTLNFFINECGLVIKVRADIPVDQKI